MYVKDCIISTIKYFEQRNVSEWRLYSGRYGSVAFRDKACIHFSKFQLQCALLQHSLHCVPSL